MGERKFWSTPCWERKAACLLSPLVEINTCATHFMNYLSCRRDAKGVDAVLLTHLHDDHIDEAAYEMIPKDMRFLVQDENNRQVVMSHGFNHVEVVGDNTRVGEVSIQKAESQHGNFIMKYPAGHTAGYVFTHPQEKTLYHAGDTIWYAGVKRNLKRFRPKVITLNAGGNSFRLGGRVIMNDEDVVKVAAAAPDAKLFVTHLEGVNHNSVTREW